MNAYDRDLSRANNFSQSEIELIRRMRADGKSLPEIGQVTGRCEGSLSKVIRRHAIPLIKQDYWSTDGRTELLLALLEEGVGINAIARQFGVSKNKIYGKAWRLGLHANERPDAIETEARRERQRADRERKAQERAECKAGRVRARPVRVMTLVAITAEPTLSPGEYTDGLSRAVLSLQRHSCKFPIGDTKQEGFHFCGEQRVQGASYCPEHCLIAFTPSRPMAKSRNPNQYLVFR